MKDYMLIAIKIVEGGSIIQRKIYQFQLCSERIMMKKAQSVTRVIKLSKS